MQLQLPETSTGIIHLLPSGLAVGPAMGEHTFLSSAEGKASVPWVVNAPHASFKLADTYACQSHLLGVIVWFSHARLTAVTLFPTSPFESWDDWSASAEAGAERTLEQLLSSVFGAQRTFGWGSIAANFDPRSGSASIAVRYV